jgi:tetratricopeptide (TPR) repeat protein
VSRPAEGIGGQEGQHLLSEPQVFSRSYIWDLQRRYFAERGIDAWRQDEVPHYVSSNPTLANSYAQIVHSFWRDRQRLGPCAEPLTLCELGAGSGRLAFHILQRLAHLCQEAGVPLASFRYVLTDASQGNLDFWREHHRFRPFFERGVLDIALFDVSRSDRLDLQLRRETIAPGSLRHPLVVIANYLFDSVPQDLYYVDEGRCEQCLVSLSIDRDPQALDAAELLANLRCHYKTRPLDKAPYAEPGLRKLLEDYQRTLSDAHLLFPATSLRCLQRLKALSREGLLVLSADKGDHRLSSLQGTLPPALVRHGSFSLNVNYHAFKSFCEQSGGMALFPDHPHRSVDVSCLLMLDGAASHVETQRAYRRHVQDLSPDDFFTIVQHAQKHAAKMTVQDILAYLRLSLYDSHQLAHYLPRLTELAPKFDQDERQAVRDAVDRAWDLYYPLGEALDLAGEIACLLYEMDDYGGALTFFRHSIEIYGPNATALFNIAVCYHMLGQRERTEPLLRRVLKLDPDHEAARELLAEIAAGNQELGNC